MKLNPGEVICPLCKGHGYDIRPNKYKCPKCHGVGKLDWIEVIVGKKPILCEPIIDIDLNSLYPSIIGHPNEIKTR